MAVIHAKPTPIQLTINSIAYEAMVRAAADRGIPFSRYASQLLEAAWSARAKPSGDDLALELAVAAEPSKMRDEKMIERIVDAENRLRKANARIADLERSSQRAQPAGAGPFIAMTEHAASLAKKQDEIDAYAQRCIDAESDVATLRTEVAAVGERILDGERWRTAFQRARRRIARIMEGRCAAPVQADRPVFPVAPNDSPLSARAQADALPGSMAKGIRSMLSIGMSANKVAKQYGVPIEVVKMFRK